MLKMMLYLSFAILIFVTRSHAGIVYSDVCAETQNCSDHKYALKSEGVYCCPYYYDLLEAALLSESTGNLYLMRRAFFPDKTSPSVNRVDVEVTITVSKIGHEPCDMHGAPSTFDCDGFDCKKSYPLSWKSGSNLNLIAEDMFLTTQTYEGVIGLVHMFVFSFDLPDFEKDLLYPEGFNKRPYLHLQLVQLKCNPEEDSTKDVVTNLISWLKEYAAHGRRPKTWDEGSRGEVEISGSSSFDIGYEDVQHFVLTIYILLNISVMLVMVRGTPGLYKQLVEKLSKETQLNKLYHTFYWGGSAVLVFLAIILFLADLLIIPYIVNNDNAKEHAIVLTVKVVIFVVELVVCSVTCKRSAKGIDFPFSCFGNIFCCCCFCCRCCSQSVKYKAVQALALWGIMSFVQHLTMTAIPVFFLMILYPGETISILALCLSALFCIIMLVSHVLYMCRFCRSREGGYRSTVGYVAVFFVQMLLLVFLLSTVVAVVLLYITMVTHGAEFNDYSSVFVSLIPSAILSVIGWLVKNRLMQNVSDVSENKTSESYELLP